MGSESGGEVVKLTLVFLSNFGEGDASSVLLVNELSKGSFSLDKAVRDVELFAELGQPDNDFDGLDVVGNDDQLGLFVLDQFGDVIKSKLEVVRLGVVDFLF